MPGLMGLITVAVAPEPAESRRGSSTVILGLRAAKAVPVAGVEAAVVAGVEAAVVAGVVAAVVAGVVAAASGVVTERRRVSLVRAERSMSAWSMSRTEAMSASVRIGKTGKKELL